jgi:hypothetical protein
MTHSFGVSKEVVMSVMRGHLTILCDIGTAASLIWSFEGGCEVVVGRRAHLQYCMIEYSLP